MGSGAGQRRITKVRSQGDRPGRADVPHTQRGRAAVIRYSTDFTT